MSEVLIKTQREEEMISFLSLHEFQVEELEHEVLQVSREGELPVYLKVSENKLYFEVDLGNVSEIASAELYFELLDLNTEILPVSFAINNANPEDPRLILAEARELGDLSADELLAVFDALELAADKAAETLSKALQS
jgi:hypothetical protein